MADVRPRILVVEDDPDQLFLYKEFLGREGFRVSIAATTDDAHAALAESPPDAVILDLSLAPGGGLDMIDQIRAGERTRDLPVIVVSGASAADPRWRGRTAGWNHFVQKPADLMALVQLLRRETGGARS